MSELKLLTHSRIKSARACQRRHHYLYDLGYRALTDAEALRFGSLVHKGLEWWWRAKQNHVDGDARLETAIAAMRQAAGEQTDAYELVRAEVLITGYHLRWLHPTAAYEVISVEAEFRTSLVNPQTGAASRIWELGGKLDVLVREIASGLDYLFEHKTTSEDIGDGSDYWRRLRMDGQVSIYYEGAAALGHQVAGCIYDVLKKPALRPLKATPVEDRKYKKDGTLYANQREADETPEEFRARLVEAIGETPDKYFRQGNVVRLEDEVAEALWDIWQIAQQLNEAKNRDRYPRNPDACSTFGRTCEFLDVCSKSGSLDDATRFKRLDHVHPELAAGGPPHLSE